MAAIEPAGDPSSTPSVKKRASAAKDKALLCLPKGLVDPGEQPADAGTVPDRRDRADAVLEDLRARAVETKAPGAAAPGAGCKGVG